MIYFAIYWIGMFGLIICTYSVKAKGQMHWKVVVCLFPISLLLPIMFVYHMIKAVCQKVRDN